MNGEKGWVSNRDGWKEREDFSCQNRGKPR